MPVSQPQRQHPVCYRCQQHLLLQRLMFELLLATDMA